VIELINIVARNGTVRHRTKAIIDSNGVVIPDPLVVIEPGDEIRRRIPSGVEETFEVIDPVFHESFGSAIPAHYQVKVRKKGTFREGTGGNYKVHVSGHNARVNIGSHDQSINTVSEGDIFGNISAALQTGVENAQ
jgi:hypothetical protein